MKFDKVLYNQILTMTTPDKQFYMEAWERYPTYSKDCRSDRQKKAEQRKQYVQRKLNQL